MDLWKSCCIGAEVQPGKPFRAQFQQIRRLKVEGGRTTRRDVTREKVYVDGEGRTRLDSDFWFLWWAPRWSTILDPVRRETWVLDNANRIVMDRAPWDESAEEAIERHAKQFGADVSASCPLPERPAADLGHQVHLRADSPEDIGTKVIEGWLCQGYRTRIEGLPGPEGTQDLVVETWKSVDIGQILLETRSSPNEQTLVRLFRIRTGQPDPALFRMPAHWPTWASVSC